MWKFHPWSQHNTRSIHHRNASKPSYPWWTPKVWPEESDCWHVHLPSSTIIYPWWGPFVLTQQYSLDKLSTNWWSAMIPLRVWITGWPSMRFSLPKWKCKIRKGRRTLKHWPQTETWSGNKAQLQDTAIFQLSSHWWLNVDTTTNNFCRMIITGWSKSWQQSGAPWASCCINRLVTVRHEKYLQQVPQLLLQLSLVQIDDHLRHSFSSKESGAHKQTCPGSHAGSCQIVRTY